MTDKKPHWAVKFAEETPIHGINIASHGCNFCDVIAWVVMILAAAIMTVIQTINLAKLYKTVPTATVLYLIRNDTISFDNSILCVQWEKNSLTVDFLDTNQSSSTPNLDINLDYLNEILANMSTDDLDNMRLSNNSFSNFDLNVLHLLLGMFADATEYESFYLPIFDDTMTVGIASVTWGNEAIRVVHDFFVQKEIPIENLLRSTASQMCSLMNIQEIVYRSGAMNYRFCSPEFIKYLGRNQMCLKVWMPMVFNNWESTGTFVKLTVDPSPFLTNETINNYLNSYHLTLDLNGAAHSDLSLNRNDLFFNAYGDSVYIFVSIVSDYQFYPTQRSACSYSLTSFDCKNLCYAHIIADLNKCWPITFTYLKPQNMSICTSGKSENNSLQISDYQSLLGNFQPLSSIVHTCSKQCLPNCFHKSYEFKTNSLRKLSHDPPKSEISIEVQKFSYQLVKESPTKNWETFLSEFGGLIGVWLGGSILAFIHIPIFILKIIFSGCFGPKRATINRDSAPAQMI